jgi:ABC-2 type transport system ATP-binding protein
MASSGLAVEAQGLRKDYGDVHALGGVDLRVESGMVFGLLGPNGAQSFTEVADKPAKPTAT